MRRSSLVAGRWRVLLGKSSKMRQGCSSVCQMDPGPIVSWLWVSWLWEGLPSVAQLMSPGSGPGLLAASNPVFLRSTMAASLLAMALYDLQVCARQVTPLSKATKASVGLNEQYPPRLVYFVYLVSCSSCVWGCHRALGSAALLEEVRHRGWALRVIDSLPFQFAPSAPCVRLRSHLIASCCHASSVMDSPPGTVSQNKL